MESHGSEVSVRAGSLTKPRPDLFLAAQIVLLAGIGLLLRLGNLGYSDLQGDEILTLCRVSEHKSLIPFLNYLLAQRKGPVQYVITCALSLFDPDFSSELALRLPFAIANILALACFFLLVCRLFTLKTAIYSTFLLAVNGIFIAFARIVQYQSFVLLGGVGSILFLALALKYENWKVTGLYIGAMAAAMSLLAHFDAAFFLPPLGVLVLHWWMKYRAQPGFARLRLHMIAAVSLFLFLVLAFYVEYALRLSSYQLQYWEERRFGDATNVVRLFQFYNPGPVFGICLIFVLIGSTRVRISSLGWQVLLAWFLPPLIFMVLFFKDSRTHAYTYLLPLFVAAGLGIEAMIGWVQTRLRGRSGRVGEAAVLVVFLFFSVISYQVFIDHDPEYPWVPKYVLGMKFDGGFVEGTFGFPYSRSWQEIGDWFQDLPCDEKVNLVTNEKEHFVSFYLPSTVRNRLRYETGDYPGNMHAHEGTYVLIVERPQSWMRELWGLSLQEWRESYAPLQLFFNPEGDTVASVYFLTQEQIETEFH